MVSVGGYWGGSGWDVGVKIYIRLSTVLLASRTLQLFSMCFGGTGAFGGGRFVQHTKSMTGLDAEKDANGAALTNSNTYGSRWLTVIQLAALAIA